MYVLMLPNEASRPFKDWRHLSDTKSSYFHCEFKQLLHVKLPQIFQFFTVMISNLRYAVL